MDILSLLHMTTSNILSNFVSSLNQHTCTLTCFCTSPCSHIQCHINVVSGIIFLINHCDIITKQFLISLHSTIDSYRLSIVYTIQIQHVKYNISHNVSECIFLLQDESEGTLVILFVHVTLLLQIYQISLLEYSCHRCHTSLLFLKILHWLILFDYGRSNVGT